MTINATPERIWPLVGHLERHADWSPKPYRAEWLSGEPDAVGSRFRSFGWLPRKPQNAMEGEVVESEPFKRFAVRSSDNAGTFVNTLVLTPNADGTTKMERIVEFPPPRGVFKLLMPVIFATVIRPGVQKGMDQLKQKAENAG